MMDKATLIGGAGLLPQQDVEIPGKGIVRVRALTRAEMLSFGDGLSVLELERKMIAKGMVEPAMTEADVETWQASSPVGEMTPVIHKINELGGIQRGSDKTAYKSV
jgi:hypothetical protein